jgi:hypothetical protein
MQMTLALVKAAKKADVVLSRYRACSPPPTFAWRRRRTTITAADAPLAHFLAVLYFT